MTIIVIDRARPRRLLVVINPFSGRKKGREIFNKTAPLYRLAGVELDIVSTERAGEATDIVASRDLSRFHGIAIYGGMSNRLRIAVL